ncbi:MAG TPA: hypothetical protein DEH22_09570, partial [Chloroflexi bacterium]|nr:hypothetical protein [Chloroflexota bacterium]
NARLQQEIEERKRIEAQLQELAITDPLTRLYNRRHFFELAKQEFARTRRYQSELAVIMLDLDHFKQVNDRYGHLIGDLVLQTFAGHVQACIRETDILARYGGEEFIILLPQTSFGNSQNLAERLRQIIATQPIVTNDYSISITLSIGISNLLEDDTDIDMLISRADQALYTAKNSGRNQVVVW